MQRNYKVVIKNGRGQEVKQVVNGMWYGLTRRSKTLCGFGWMMKKACFSLWVR